MKRLKLVVVLWETGEVICRKPTGNGFYIQKRHQRQTEILPPDTSEGEAMILAGKRFPYPEVKRVEVWRLNAEGRWEVMYSKNKIRPPA